ncbi:hypothetical protein M430DRAFT_105151 [Amorphotheca resinae ATCC 22711]|uniref:Uncharacterized protein n=1 Tax=Amorphotheca resinae ATCC 22711 TaxID=857342 RepID=A0A2T3AYH9_AMORE|nr:hypothetical protein M430DRAFT_105151 [Amorphotheca resinae ATCC 22711]PSS15113.1 hypothetical protein M430DRAFT_105151 [Amorphotheca resinae ATCC 22711]
MSAQNTGRQSPSPERQSGAQQKDAPSSGQGVNETSKNKRESQADINALTSNPKGPMDDHVAETTKKTVKNVAGDITY